MGQAKEELEEESDGRRLWWEWKEFSFWTVQIQVAVDGVRISRSSLQCRACLVPLDINSLIIYADNWSNKTVDVIYLIDNCDELESTPEWACRGEKGQIFYEWKLLELS